MKYLLLLSILILETACAGFYLKTNRNNPLLDEAQGLYLKLGNTEKALSLLKQADIQYPHQPKVTFLLADILDTTGRPADALPYYFDTVETVHAQGKNKNESIAAAMAIVAIRDRVTDFQIKLEKMFERINNRPGRLPLEAWFQLSNLKLAMARKKGDYAAAKKALFSAGCIHKWTAAGPFGPFVWEAFDAAKGPLHGKAWPKSIDLGPDRQSSSPFNVDSNTCFTSLKNPSLPMDGVVWGRTTLILDKAKKVSFRIQTVGGAVVFAGGNEIFRRDPRTAWSAGTSWFTAELPAGATEISVALPTLTLPPSLSLVALSDDGLPAFSKQGEYSASHELVQLDSQVLSPDFEDDEVSKYAACKIALWWDDIDLAFRLIEDLRGQSKAPAPALMLLEAEATAADPSLPSNMSYERARTIESHALKKEPRFWLMRVHLFDRLISDGRTDDAISLLQYGIDLSPQEPQLVSRLLEILASQGWWTDANEALMRLEAVLPNSCEVLNWKLSIARSEMRFDEAMKIAQEIVKCDSSSKTLAEELLRASKWDEAVLEIGRLAKRDAPNAASSMETVQAAIAAGDMDDAAAKAALALETFKVDPSLRLTLSDLLLASQRSDDAYKVLNDGLKLPLSPKLAFLAAGSFEKGEEILSQYRVDGLKIIDEYKAENPKYNSAAVLVLDRAVYVIGEFGETTIIVHTITQVNTDEAIESQIELGFPEGALLLAARNIKPDGRVLEPEVIPQKSTLSLPDLAPGDFIEAEYLMYQPPSRIYPRGFDPGRFYFQNFDTAFHRSELIVSIPKDMQITLDPRGPCPKPEETEIAGRRKFAWHTRGALPYPAEPLSPDPTEYLPSIRIWGSVVPKNVLSKIRDMLEDLIKPSRHIQNALIQATKFVPSTDHFRTRNAIYRYVMNNIEESDDIFEQASHIIARKSGNRARAFHAMLLAAGYSPRMAVVKPAGFDETKGAVFNINDYSEVLVYVPEDGWISFASNPAPYRYLMPRLRQRPALFIDNGEESNTDKGSKSIDAQLVDATLRVDKDGSAVIEVKETLRGVFANEWREELKSIQSPEWGSMFQHKYLSSELPGSELLSFDVRGLDSPDKDLILEYKTYIERFIHRESGAATASLPFKTALFEQVGGLPARQTPLVVSSWFEKKVRISVITKGPVSVSLKSSVNKATGKWGSVNRFEILDGNKLVIGYWAKIHADRISPADYPSFAQFATSFDRVSDMEITAAGMEE